MLQQIMNEKTLEKLDIYHIEYTDKIIRMII